MEGLPPAAGRGAHTPRPAQTCCPRSGTGASRAAAFPAGGLAGRPGGAATLLPRCPSSRNRSGSRAHRLCQDLSRSIVYQSLRVKETGNHPEKPRRRWVRPSITVCPHVSTQQTLTRRRGVCYKHSERPGVCWEGRLLSAPRDHLGEHCLDVGVCTSSRRRRRRAGWHRNKTVWVRAGLLYPLGEHGRGRQVT